MMEFVYGHHRANQGATPDLIDAGNQMGMRIDELHHCFANSSTW
jgi:hypothetical protein